MLSVYTVPGTVHLVMTEWTREPVPESVVAIFSWDRECPVVSECSAMRTQTDRDVPHLRVTN